MEYLENLDSVNKKIKIENRGLKITEDPLLLVGEIKKNIKKEIKRDIDLLDIGAGQGIISVLLSEIECIKKIYSVEIQKEIYDILVENVKNNKLENKIVTINEDIKKIEGQYDCIVSNPPYRKINSGKKQENESERISKYEEKLTLEELFYTIKKLLKNHGYFFVIIPNDRLNDTFSYIYKNNLNIIYMKINEYKKRQLIVIFGKKGGKMNSSINIEVENKL